MKKIGRNALCPCGSGKKFKHCCKYPALTATRVVAVSYDSEADKLRILGGDLLANRVKREASVIAASFDRLTAGYTDKLEHAYGMACGVVFAASERYKNDARLTTLVGLLTNALKSFTGSIYLLRGGWRLQPYILLRNGLEAAIFAYHLSQNPHDAETYQSGKLKTAKALNSTKQLMPFIGGVYGRLSEDFVHIGTRHRSIQKGTGYEDFDTELKEPFDTLTGVALVIYTISEALFFEIVDRPLFFERIDESHLKFNPSAEALKLVKSLDPKYGTEPPTH